MSKITTIAKTKKASQRRKFGPEEKGVSGAKDCRDQRTVTTEPHPLDKNAMSVSPHRRK